MNLTDMITQYLEHDIFEKIYQSPEYQAAWEQKNTAERELIEALTRKQRRLFHECVRQRDALTAIELNYLLRGCTLVVSGDFGPR